MLNDVIDKLKNDLVGYHIEIQLYPSGGIIDIEGCEECGTDELFRAGISFGSKRSAKTIEEAVAVLIEKIEKEKEAK